MTGVVLLVLAVAWPLALATILATSAVFRGTLKDATWWSWLVTLAPTPALAAALATAEGARLELPWLLLGSVWEIDPARRALLAAAAMVWLLAGLQMRTRFFEGAHRTSLQLGWLLAMTGNVAAMLVQDVAGFYTFFALMSFSAYLLVVHTRTADALSAARVYVAMTVLGEVLILSGLLIATRGLSSPLLVDVPAAIATSSYAGIATLCLWMGFGVKTAVVGLHLWLPGAYTHAPPPVSAVLGGAMINAGVLGILTTLPLGTISLPTLGEFIIVMGLTGAFGGALVGMTQRASVTVLGYSSISQMGLLMVPIGAALHSPSIAPLAIGAVTLFAVHHGLAKASLFLGVDTARRSGRFSRVLVVSLCALVGASLAGAPFTSGAAAKLATKTALYDVASVWPWLGTALSLAAAGTTLLVVRALWCLAHETTEDAVLSSWPVGWLSSVGLVALGVWWLDLPSAAPSWPGAVWSDAVSLVWPIALALLTAGAAAWASSQQLLPSWRVPSGDLLVLLRALWRWVRAWGNAIGSDAGDPARSSASSTVGSDDGVSATAAVRSLRSRVRVEHPAKADDALRSVAPIVFGVLVVMALLLFQLGVS
jgi:formate hydrogenlyase subunit 3/multisubunit Na+/H+ antiporter MnhD subunit